MLIPCEKCTTTYELDERLLPSSGAPVQCTSCGFIFTAKPPKPGTTPTVVAPVPQAPPAVSSSPATPRSQQTTIAYGQRLPTVDVPPTPVPAPGPSAEFAMPAPEPATTSPKRTQMFALQDLPVPSAAPVEIPAETPVVPAVAPVATTPEPKRTQMFALQPDLEIPALPTAEAPKPETPEAEAVSVPPPPPPKRTQMFAFQPAPSPSAEKASEPKRTQMFALTPSGPSAVTPNPEGAPPSSDPKRTQMFALSPQSAAQNPGTTPSDPKRTQMFAIPQDANAAAPASPAAVRPEPRRVPMPARDIGANRVATAHGVKVELPPEDRSGRGTREPLFVLETSPKGRVATIAAILALVAAVVVAYLVVRSVRGTSNHPSAEAEATRLAAFSELRRDDFKSRRRAIERLQSLVTDNPSFIAARADWVLAIVLELDDTRMSAQRAQESSDAISRKISNLREQKVPSDWQSRVNVYTEELETLRTQREAMSTRAAELDQESARAMHELEVLSQDLSSPDPVVRRASMMYAAVKGLEQAAGLIQEYAQSPANDGWDGIALAELAVNSRVPERMVQEAQQRMTDLREKDSTFLRASVLGARLWFVQERPSEALALLDAVRTLNPEHEVALSLIAWAEARNETQ